MGMATVINALALQNAIENGTSTRVLSAIIPCRLFVSHLLKEELLDI